MTVHSSTTHESQKVEATQMSVNGSMGSTPCYIHTMECYSVIKRTEVWIQATTCMNLKTSCYPFEARHKRPHNIWFHFCEMPWTVKSQKADSRVPGSGEKGMESDCLVGMGLLWRWWKCFETRQRWRYHHIVKILSANEFFALNG